MCLKAGFVDQWDREPCRRRQERLLEKGPLRKLTGRQPDPPRELLNLEKENVAAVCFASTRTRNNESSPKKAVVAVGRVSLQACRQRDVCESDSLFFFFPFFLLPKRKARSKKKRRCALDFCDITILQRA